MEQNVGIGIKSNTVEKEQSAMGLDLTAVFKLLEEDISRTIDKAEKEGWTPAKLIKEVEGLI